MIVRRLIKIEGVVGVKHEEIAHQDKSHHLDAPSKYTTCLINNPFRYHNNEFQLSIKMLPSSFCFISKTLVRLYVE